MLPYYVGIAFTIWMAVECVRRGQASPWLWIVLLFGPVGSAVYFVSEVLGPARPRIGRGVSRRELVHARAEVRRLDNAEAWTTYAQALRRRGSFSEAVEAARSAVERDFESPPALYELGLAELELGNAADSVAALSRLVALAPNHDSGEARYALALAYERSGELERALETLENLGRTTSLPKVLYRLAELQARSGDRERARDSLRRIIDEAQYVPRYHEREVRPWVRKAKRALDSLSA